jgi:hypothetical protein
MMLTTASASVARDPDILLKPLPLTPVRVDEVEVAGVETETETETELVVEAEVD